MAFLKFSMHTQSKVAEQISQIVPQEFATSLNVVYFPQLGDYMDLPSIDTSYVLIQRIPYLRSYAGRVER